MRRVATVVIALSALIGSYFTATTGTDSEVEKCFRAKVNAERSARNIATLADSEDMNIIASTHSEEMAAAGTIYHNENLPNEKGVKPFVAVGENVGMGSTCQIIHDAFIGSPGHKANILDRDYQRLGVGVEEADETIFVTLVFHTPAKPKPKTATPKPAATCLCS